MIPWLSLLAPSSRLAPLLGWAPPPDLPAPDPLAVPLADLADPGGFLRKAPETFADAERALAPSIAELLDAGAAQIVLPLFVMTLAAVLVGLIRRRLAAIPDAPTPGPAAVAAALACVLLYALGRAFDPLLSSLLARPVWFPEDRWADVGWFEWKLLGRPWAWGALPLADHPGLAIVVHVIVWVAAWAGLRFVLDWLWAGDLRWSAPTRDLPSYFRWVGSSTTRRADQRFRRWLGLLITVLLPAHLLAGARLAESPGSLPPPGAWVVGGLLLWTTVFHLLVTGRPPAPEKTKTKPEGEAEDEVRELARAPLIRLREALERLRPGVELDSLELRGAAPGRRAPFPPAVSALVRELFHDLTGDERPWAHQAELLAHFSELWRMEAGPACGEVPTLAEEQAASVVRTAELSTPHALMLAPEGSGRTTATLLAALHVFFDRGATSLVIVRDRAAARRYAQTLERALLGSSARWNVLVCTAGEDLSAALIGGRTPAIVVADLEACEAEVLCDGRTDAFLGRLGLIVADDVDSFTGVAEMHLQLCARRLWALLDRLHEAPYPVALLATAGDGASGMDAWAKHVLAVPMRQFADDGAPTRAQELIRRRDLVDGTGADIPVSVLAEACDAAGLPWHLRLAGDGNRTVRRAAFDLGNLRRHHVDDPRAAAIVIVEGTYPDVRREADRLTHAGVALDREAFPEAAPVVLVLAPPGDEEMVLHEEAEDARHRELVASLPRAVPLAEPRVVRQRHFDRAIGREQDLAALRERFGGRFVDETVAELGPALRRREVLHIDPGSEQIVPRTLLRAVKEGALGQPIDAACVSDRASRATILDAGTSELLLTADASVVGASYPPGRIFLHPRGRFMVLGDPASAPTPDASGPASSPATGPELSAEQIGGRERTTSDRGVRFEPEATVEWTERQFGGRKLPIAFVRGRLSEELAGVRRYAPGPTLVDQRVYERPLVVRYGTDACLVATAATSAGPGAGPSDEALIPLAAALRMILPCSVRAASELVDVDLVDLDGARLLCIFDRTPGASGFARYVCERGLRDLLELARMVLERCVGPEFARLRHIHDRSPGSDPARWRVGEALRWLDEVLDAPPASEAGPVEGPGLAGPRVEFVSGEGPGDLGRLWISRTGRTDDLVWTRHSWWSPVAVAGHGPGKLSFDVAVERPAIAAARRRALALAGQSLQLRERLDLDSSFAHAQLLTADRTDLDPIRATLSELAGDALVPTILALVAAIPLTARPLTVADRGPLAVLARRRADLDAKLLLACALLPAEVGARVVHGPEGQAWLQFQPLTPTPSSGSSAVGGRETWSLQGPRPELVAEEPARRATLVLDLDRGST